MNGKRVWSSKVVVVSLFSASGALSGCSDPYDSDRRNYYDTRAECVADYSERECKTQSSGAGTFFYLGPSYRGNWRDYGSGAYTTGGGPGRAAMATGTVNNPTTVSRGGFGSTGRSYSSRGG
jgi:hypothetical protein